MKCSFNSFLIVCVIEQEGKETAETSRFSSHAVVSCIQKKYIKITNNIENWKHLLRGGKSNLFSLLLTLRNFIFYVTKSPQQNLIIIEVSEWVNEYWSTEWHNFNAKMKWFCVRKSIKMFHKWRISYFNLDIANFSWKHKITTKNEKKEKRFHFIIWWKRMRDKLLWNWA